MGTNHTIMNPYKYIHHYLRLETDAWCRYQFEFTYVKHFHPITNRGASPAVTFHRWVLNNV